jgi:DNA-directed RNA polymerase subunit M/transcription elongation factor TFIIS
MICQLHEVPFCGTCRPSHVWLEPKNTIIGKCEWICSSCSSGKHRSTQLISFVYSWIQSHKNLSWILHESILNFITYKKLINKYFQYTSDISGSKTNIAYLNDTCKNVSSAIRKLETRKYGYEIGEFLICRKCTKSKNSVFNVNFKYEIVLANNQFMKLKNVKTGVVQPLDIEKVRKNFIFAHCATCHSAQGYRWWYYNIWL